MPTIGSSAIAAAQARRFSARTQNNMRKRGGGAVGGTATNTATGRTSLYKQIYNNGSGNGVISLID